MVEISKCEEQCFADQYGGCQILVTPCTGKENCGFYKPKDCEEWIRIENSEGIWIMPPEEYYEMRNV